MFERVLYTVLTNAIEVLKSEPKIIDRAFRHLGYTAAESRKIRAAFLAEVPTVLHQYPREDTQPPILCIILGKESETQHFLGESGGMIDAAMAEEWGDKGLVGTDLQTSVYQHEYEILIYTKSADLTLWYYEIAKLALTSNRTLLIDSGMLDVNFSGGDISPDPRFLPSFLFGRKMSVRCSSEYTAQFVGFKPLIVRSITGLHVEDVDEGDTLSAHVTPYIEPIVEEE